MNFLLSIFDFLDNVLEVVFEMFVIRLFGPENTVLTLGPRFKLMNICCFFIHLTDFPLFLTKIWDSRHVQLAKYTVLDEESESEVKKCKILEPGGENRKTGLRKLIFYFSYFSPPGSKFLHCLTSGSDSSSKTVYFASWKSLESQNLIQK